MRGQGRMGAGRGRVGAGSRSLTGSDGVTQVVLERQLGRKLVQILVAEQKVASILGLFEVTLETLVGIARHSLVGLGGAVGAHGSI